MWHTLTATPLPVTPCGLISQWLLGRMVRWMLKNCRCLIQSGINGTYDLFSSKTCRIMIAMLDRDYTGKMRFNEFKELWAALNAWKQNFMAIDLDQSGTVDRHEMRQAIALMGYRLSLQALAAIVRRYSKNDRIFFDNYVVCCVKLHALTDFFSEQTTCNKEL